jgi:hypothetical protein
MKTVAGLIALLVTLPIWFYLVYKILEAINASELMWFLFWVYLPTTVLASVLARLSKND